MQLTWKTLMCAIPSRFQHFPGCISHLKIPQTRAGQAGNKGASAQLQFSPQVLGAAFNGSSINV